MLSRGGHRVQQAFVVIQTACAVALARRDWAHGEDDREAFERRRSDTMLQHVAYVTAVPVHSWSLEPKYLPAADRLLAISPRIPGVEASGAAHAGPVRRG